VTCVCGDLDLLWNDIDDAVCRRVTSLPEFRGLRAQTSTASLSRVDLANPWLYVVSTAR